MSSDPLRVGLLGVGRGASQLLPALTSSPYGRLVAAADANAAVRERIARDYQIPTYASADELCNNDSVEAVWVATPNQFHAEHAIMVASHRKHVIVSKPLAISLDETARMNLAAQRNDVHLLAGHTQSMAPTIRKMAEMVHSGELGKLGMLHTWHATDWMHRPRQPAELDVGQGGGPVFRQASHQVDIIRAIAGKSIRSVRAQVVQLDPERGAPGAYSVFLEFEDGTPATIVYSGYGHFGMSELLGTGRNTLGLFGLTLVTCARGDLRESPDGLYLYTHGNQRQHIAVEEELRGAAELQELYDAVRHQKPLTHDGVWGQATLEVCLAINESARTHTEIQIAG